MFAGEAMSAPVLGSILGIVLVGIIFPDRLSTLVSPVFERSLVSSRTALGPCPGFRHPMGMGTEEEDDSDSDCEVLRVLLPPRTDAAVAGRLVGMAWSTCIPEVEDDRCFNCHELISMQYEEIGWVWNNGALNLHLHAGCLSAQAAICGREHATLANLSRLLDVIRNKSKYQLFLSAIFSARDAIRSSLGMEPEEVPGLEGSV